MVFLNPTLRNIHTGTIDMEGSFSLDYTIFGPPCFQQNTISMKNFFSFTLLSLLIFTDCKAQNKELPYHEIPSHPEEYSPGSVAARMIDGLGYRYYWATEGLTEKDLDYAPPNDGRSARSTLDHIFHLSNTVRKTCQLDPKSNPIKLEGLSFEHQRRQTLENLKMASDQIRGKTAEEMEQLNVVFSRRDQRTDYPFWNLLNGPLADAIYHVGQIVSFRRSSGNPINSKVNVFRGKTRE